MIPTQRTTGAISSKTQDERLLGVRELSSIEPWVTPWDGPWPTHDGTPLGAELADEWRETRAYQAGEAS
jgi:hypothetical protein